MTGKTHIVGGLAAGLAAVSFAPAASSLSPIGVDEIVLCLGLSVVGSLAPDIDLHSSKAGHKAGAASWLIQIIFGHRTLFHSPLLMLLIYLFMMSVFPEYRLYTLYFLIGMGSHLLLDLCNKKGIPLLYPFPKRFHIASVKTGGAAEAGLTLVLAASSLFLLVYQVMFAWFLD